MALRLSEATETMRQKAEQICMRMGHFYQGCEHFFLAVLESEPWLESFLEQNGSSADEITQNITNICGPPDEKPMWEEIIETPRLKKIFKKYAGREAEGAKAMRVEPCHVIAALCREARSIPIRVLIGLDIDTDKLRAYARENPNRSENVSGGLPKTPPQGFPQAGTPYSNFMANRGSGGQVPPQGRPQAFTPPPNALGGQVPPQKKATLPPGQAASLSRPSKKRKRKLKPPPLTRWAATW